MQLRFVLVMVALTHLASATWLATPPDRRYVLPGISPNWVSYWGLSAQDAGGSFVTGLKIWTDQTTEATDIEENFNGRRLYFATEKVRGLTLPTTGTAYVDCAMCLLKGTLIPEASLRSSYTLPKADASLDNFQVVVVAVQDGTTVTTSGTNPDLSRTLNFWEQLIIDSSQLPSPASLTSSNPVAVFVYEKSSDWRFSVRQLP